MNTKTLLELMARRRRLQKHEHWTRPQLEAYQAEALRGLRDYAYARSPFYQRFHKGLFKAPLQDLPVLTKAILMDHFDELVSDRAIHLADVKSYMAGRPSDKLFLGRYQVQITSGTSGHPGLFLYNREEWSAMLAEALRAFRGAGIRVRLTHRVKMAGISTTNPSHMSMQGATSMRGWWLPILQMAATEPVATMVERLNGWQPEVLLAYASILRILADEQIAGRLRIAPRTVVSSSEVLTPETRRRAVQAWGNVVFNMYATTDCGGIATECDQHRGMHLQEDLSIFEVVDRENRPVPTGDFGEKMLVTVLGSRTQPLIRYELDDSVRLLAEGCPCGRPFRLIGEVQGRQHEILTFRGVAGGSMQVHPMVFHEIMDALPVRGWQVLQEIDCVRLLLANVQGPVDEPGLIERVQQALAKQGAAPPRILVQRVAAIPQTAAGKAPLVRSNVQHASA